MLKLFLTFLLLLLVPIMATPILVRQGTETDQTEMNSWIAPISYGGALFVPTANDTNFWKPTLYKSTDNGSTWTVFAEYSGTPAVWSPTAWAMQPYNGSLWLVTEVGYADPYGGGYGQSNLFFWEVNLTTGVMTQRGTYVFDDGTQSFRVHFNTWVESIHMTAGGTLRWLVSKRQNVSDPSYATLVEFDCTTYAASAHDLWTFSPTVTTGMVLGPVVLWMPNDTDFFFITYLKTGASTSLQDPNLTLTCHRVSGTTVTHNVDIPQHWFNIALQDPVKAYYRPTEDEAVWMIIGKTTDGFGGAGVRVRIPTPSSPGTPICDYFTPSAYDSTNEPTAVGFARLEDDGSDGFYYVGGSGDTQRVVYRVVDKRDGTGWQARETIYDENANPVLGGGTFQDQDTFAFLEITGTATQPKICFEMFTYSFDPTGEHQFAGVWYIAGPTATLRNRFY